MLTCFSFECLFSSIFNKLSSFFVTVLQMYEDYDLLAENHECQFQSTVPEYENPQDLFSALKRGELTNFQAFW